MRLSLATWRLTSLLVQERGPYAVFENLRREYQGTELGKLLSCVWCSSIWAALIIILLDRVCPILVDILVLSAGAIGVDKHASS